MEAGLNASLYDASISSTANSLRAVIQTQPADELSQLTLPEIDRIVELVARILPAGNVPAVILNGLLRLPDRHMPLRTVKRDLGLLFKSLDKLYDQAIYGAFFAGPAAIIWGYQNLLKLAGKNPEDAFPEGIWQFYVDYALREDTARHVNETYGFDAMLARHHIQLGPVDRITAWVMTAIHTLHQYNALLENEWRERMYLELLRQTVEGTPFQELCSHLYTLWQYERPYRRGPDAGPEETYPAYRRARFDRFLVERIGVIPAALRQQWRERIQIAEANDLPAYQRQMSILTYLEPGPYDETRVPLSLERSYVGVIYNDHYYLIPACIPGTDIPNPVSTVRELIATMLAHPAATPPLELASLARIRRTAWATLRKQLNPAVLKELNALRLAPILINADLRSPHLPLSELRQAERGVGDHALTLFDTGQSIVFDQSHIFFDGIWGAALAEIMTNEAVSWAFYLHKLPPATPGSARPYALSASLAPADRKLIQRAPHLPAEVAAESDEVDLEAMLKLRKLFKQRSDLLQLSVNDLLVLYRAIHAFTYVADAALIAELETLAAQPSTRPAALAALEAVRPDEPLNPVVLIPIDVSVRNPRERLYPMSFEVPLAELGLIDLHARVMAALETAPPSDGFEQLQRAYLSTLAGFGEVMRRSKEIAAQGQSMSIGTLKLLAHLPAPLQRMLDQIPGRFDVLNDVIKGREVFSNVGQVVPTSTLSRFMTAKDDNDQKTLAWGVLTDAHGVMHITLRDFRPHVGLLDACGYRGLAERIVQDYLFAYTRGLNRYIYDLLRVVEASIGVDSSDFEKRQR